MPTDLVTVWSVTSSATSRPGVVRWVISAVSADGRVHRQFLTLNPWEASFCLRAKQLKKTLSVTWAETDYGNRITDLELMAPVEPEAA